MDKLTLLSLHRHFLAADAVKQFLFVAVPVDPKTSRVRDDILDVAQMWSSMLRLQIFYALMYVVVEGYREFGCQDPVVDPLLAQSHFVEGFRRFRNANFHFQEDPFSPKAPRIPARRGQREVGLRPIRCTKSFLREAASDQGVLR